MKAKQSVEKNILSPTARTLIKQAKQEERDTLKAQVRKEIEELKKSAAISDIHWDDDKKTQRIIDRQKMYAHNQALTDCLSIPSLKKS